MTSTSNQDLFLLLGFLVLVVVFLASLVYLKWKVAVLAADGRLQELRQARKSRGMFFGVLTLLATICCLFAGYIAFALLSGVLSVFYFLEAYDPDLIFSCDTLINMYGGRKR